MTKGSPSSTSVALLGSGTPTSLGPWMKMSKIALLRFLPYLMAEWRYALATAVSMLVGTGLVLVQPWIFGFLLVGGVLVNKNLQQLPWVLILLAGSYVAGELSSYLQAYFSDALAARADHRLRCDLYRHLEVLPMRFFDNSRSGDLVSRITGDTEQVERVLIGIVTEIAKDIITVSGVLVLLLYVQPELTVLVLPPVVLLAVALNVFKKTIKRYSKDLRKVVSELFARSYEVLSSIRLVKSFSMEEYEGQEFQGRSLKIVGAKLKVTKLDGLYSSSLTLTADFAVLAVIFVAAPLVVSESLSLGLLVAFISYVERLFEPIKGLSKVNFSIQKGNASAERILEIFDIQPEDFGDRDIIEPAPLKGRIEFKNVSFFYDKNKMDKFVLRNFNLAVESGETVAIVGRSGIGKTTVVNLLLRFYEPTSGTILIDRRPIEEWNLVSLRRAIALVSQDPVLFSGSIRENIAYGKIDASHEEIVEAARIANADDFIMDFPDGYRTQIGERGVKLSTGQRQRIAIARAILKDPRILIMDEATSNVDSESEALIQEALKRLAIGRTIIVIAHRLSTIMNAKKIVLLEGGAVSAVGTHQQLLLESEPYAQLYETQLTTKIRPLAKNRDSKGQGQESKERGQNSASFKRG